MATHKHGTQSKGNRGVTRSLFGSTFPCEVTANCIKTRCLNQDKKMIEKYSRKDNQDNNKQHLMTFLRADSNATIIINTYFIKLLISDSEFPVFFTISPPNTLRTDLLLLLAEVSLCVVGCCRGRPPVSLLLYRFNCCLAKLFPSIFPEVKGPSLNLKGEGGDLSNERKAITFQGVIIRLSYQMCDGPFLCLKRLFKCRRVFYCCQIFLPARFFLEKYWN